MATPKEARIAYPADADFCTRCRQSTTGERALRGRWSEIGIDHSCTLCQACCQQAVQLLDTDPDAAARFFEELKANVLMTYGKVEGSA